MFRIPDVCCGDIIPNIDIEYTRQEIKENGQVVGEDLLIKFDQLNSKQGNYFFNLKIGVKIEGKYYYVNNENMVLMN